MKHQLLRLALAVTLLLLCAWPRASIAQPATAPGTVVAWGWNDPTVPVAAQSGIASIAASEAHSVALKENGSVVVWGWPGFGQTTVPTAARSRVTAIAAGGACDFGCNGHTVALKDDGTVVAWGRNEAGQVTGTPTTNGYPYFAMASPVTLGGQVLSGVTAIAAGWTHTVALKNDGSVVSLGSLDQTTVPVAAQSGVTAIAAGAYYTVALKNDGSVVAWGNNQYGQTAVPVAAQSGVTAIAASYWIGDTGGHIVALKNDGTVVAWGMNSDGQATVPPGLGGVTAIAAGGLQTLALIGGVPLLPSLNARPNGNELILSWPTNAVGFTLQSTHDLTPPVTWTDTTNVPAVIGAHFTLTNNTSGGTRFFRLRKM